jgi:hypothetical protein
VEGAEPSRGAWWCRWKLSMVKAVQFGEGLPAGMICDVGGEVTTCVT